MHKRTKNDVGTALLLSVEDAAKLFSLGVESMRRLARECGAVRRYGKRVLVDRSAVEKYFAEQAEREEKW